MCKGASAKVLLLTEKPFAAGAVTSIEKVCADAGYELAKCEKYASKADMLAAVVDADALIIRSDIIDAEVLAQAAKCKIVVRAGAGFDNIDLEACTQKEVVAMNTPGQNSNAVAELVFGMLVSQIRNQYDGSSGFELRGKTLGLFGCGNVSTYMILIAQGFGMVVKSFDPFMTPEQISAKGATPVSSVEELFECQFVSLHIPATEQTKNSINNALIGKMPKNAVLVNSARPEVVHEADLLAMFEARPDFSYVSDVVPKNMDAIKAQLGESYSKRCFCTKKKMGAQTSEANNNAGIAAAEQIIRFFKNGDVKFQVNK
jgi:D-3-phosphoglycerate dehydrogenase